ncbi:MAG: maleylpyruvate isomerase family mycothiol-dependent enzyme [Acidimicrobiales bacterium]
MDPATHIAHLEADAARLLDAYEEDARAAVPCCPPWDRAALLHHVAGAHSWHRAQVEAGPGERVRFKQSPQAPEGDDLPAWYADNVRGLVDALSHMDTDGTWPTWAGERPGSFYPRRMALETTVHLWDATDRAIDPELAIDGIDEHLGLFAPLAPGDSLPRHGTIHLHATDADGEWLVRLGNGGITYEHGHAKGDVALRGTASDLYLWCWNRVPVDERFEVFGDANLLEVWPIAVAI